MSGTWSDGEYERTAVQLEPGAAALIAAVDPVAGERLVDLACGNGNASVLAAGRGAEVVGVDLAERLLERARERVGGKAEFVVADATELPFPDAGFDVAVSVFGIANGVLSGSPAKAIGEITRVLAPGGRLGLASWYREGAIFEVIGLVRRLLQGREGVPSGTDERPSELSLLESQLGLTEVASTDHQLSFTAGSAAEWWEEQVNYHPLWRLIRASVADLDRWQDVRSEGLALLEGANEDPDAFAVTSRYAVNTAVRAG